MGRDVAWDAAGEPDAVDQASVGRIGDDDLLAGLEDGKKGVQDAVEAAGDADTLMERVVGGSAEARYMCSGGLP